MSCSKCVAKLNRNIVNSYIGCSVCRSFFHAGCTNMLQDDIDIIKKEKNYFWLCSICEVKKQKKSDCSATSNYHSDCGNNRFNSKKVNELLFVPNNVEANLINIIEQLKKSDTKMNERLDSIEKSIALIQEVVEENKNLKTKIVDLELRLDKYEQKTLNDAIEIIGVPQQENEVIENTVVTIITQGLNVEIEAQDIQKCFRVINKSSNRPGKIIVILKSSATKTVILNASRKLKSLSSKIIHGTSDSHTRMYINECLTAYKRNLLKAAKEIKQEKNFKYLWIRNANIMMRKKDGDTIKYIRTSNDLDNL